MGFPDAQRDITPLELPEVLYPIEAQVLILEGAGTILGGEFEEALLSLVKRLEAAQSGSQPESPLRRNPHHGSDFHPRPAGDRALLHHILRVGGAHDDHAGLEGSGGGS